MKSLILSLIFKKYMIIQDSRMKNYHLMHAIGKAHVLLYMRIKLRHALYHLLLNI